jgi:hypothetical protein
MSSPDQWNPACWTWNVRNLGHLRRANPLEIEKKAERALRKWHAGRCAMCGEVASLVTDHDHKTGLVRGLLCHQCNVSEGVQPGADTPLGRYRARSPAAILGVTVRYFDHFHGAYAKPEAEHDEEEFFRRASKIINEL